MSGRKIIHQDNGNIEMNLHQGFSLWLLDSKDDGVFDSVVVDCVNTGQIPIKHVPMVIEYLKEVWAQYGKEFSD